MLVHRWGERDELPTSTSIDDEKIVETLGMARRKEPRDESCIRRNANCPPARQALRRPRMLLQNGVSGPMRRLTQNGTGIFCNTDNFVPLVVPGYSPILKAARLLGPSQESSRKEAERATRELAPPAPSSSSTSVSERSDELATRTLVPFPELQNPK